MHRKVELEQINPQEYITNLRTNIHWFENIVNNNDHTTQESINDVNIISQYSDTTH